MNLQQLIFIIHLIVIRKDTQCYAKKRHDFSLPETKQTISNGKLLNVKGISNCSYENTVEISINKNALLANGSYIYDSQTLVPPQLMGNYDYEVLYNGSRRKVPQHKRACICHLKPCITLCSNDIPESYQYVGNNNMDDFLDVFHIDMTLANTRVVTKNIVEDFEPIVLAEFCDASYMLSPEEDTRLDWTLFENGTLLRHIDRKQLKRTEYCFDLYRATIDNVDYDLINPRVCAASKKSFILLNFCAQVFSIIFLLLIIIAHCCLPELLTVKGKCFLTYVISSALSIGIFGFINILHKTSAVVPCWLMAYFNHYLLLSHYTWLGIICFNNWRQCCDVSCNYLYMTYAMFGFPFPFLMTLLPVVARYVNIIEFFKPLISTDRCILKFHSWVVSLYLYGPCLIILVFCLITFISTSRLPIAMLKVNVEQKELELELRKVRYNFYSQLFVMIVICWSFDVLSLIFYLLDSPSALLDCITAAQALLLFVYFFLRQKVRNVWRKRTSKEVKCTKLETTI